MQRSGQIHVVGDIHGQLEKLTGLLQAAGLIGADLAWTGGAASLWFMGDFCDRGPDGVGAVDLAMRLQAEAAAAGGTVGSVLGNHEVLILAVHRFGGGDFDGWGGLFVEDWLRNGGRPDDLRRLTDRHVAWLSDLPLLARAGDLLLTHADAAVALNYGPTPEEANRAVRAVLHSDDPVEWGRLLEASSNRNGFGPDCPDGAGCARRFLDAFGGRRIVHGHTPIPALTYQRAATVTEPYVYADGLCVNVDGGMFLGGPGFVYSAPDGGAS